MFLKEPLLFPFVLLFILPFETLYGPVHDITVQSQASWFKLTHLYSNHGIYIQAASLYIANHGITKLLSTTLQDERGLEAGTGGGDDDRVRGDAKCGVFTTLGGLLLFCNTSTFVVFLQRFFVSVFLPGVSFPD